jgi:hypothetical protein
MRALTPKGVFPEGDILNEAKDRVPQQILRRCAPQDEMSKNLRHVNKRFDTKTEGLEGKKGEFSRKIF